MLRQGIDKKYLKKEGLICLSYVYNQARPTPTVTNSAALHSIQFYLTWKNTHFLNKGFCSQQVALREKAKNHP